MATGGAMWRRRVRRWLLRRVVVWSLRFMVAGCPTLGRRLKPPLLSSFLSTFLLSSSLCRLSAQALRGGLASSPFPSPSAPLSALVVKTQVVAKVDWFVPRSPEFLAGNMVDSDVSEPSLQNSVPLQADHDSLVPPPFQIWPCSFGA
uniref:Uncharacterized protein n=1 Tax=Oryza barthii TaxID=65489 RepID=A0A0D3GYA3_9ORYZ